MDGRVCDMYAKIQLGTRVGIMVRLEGSRWQEVGTWRGAAIDSEAHRRVEARREGEAVQEAYTPVYLRE